jgi:hypothetical protein
MVPYLKIQKHNIRTASGTQTKRAMAEQQKTKLRNTPTYNKRNAAREETANSEEYVKQYRT